MRAARLVQGACKSAWFSSCVEVTGLYYDAAQALVQQLVVAPVLARKVADAALLRLCLHSTQELAMHPRLA